MKKMSKPKTIKIDEVEYVRSDCAHTEAERVDGLPYQIVRCDRSGVFAGYVKEISGQSATLINSRMLWYWDGAATLSQLAMEGVKLPDKCKFPMEVPVRYVTDVVERIPCTQKAKDSIDSVPVWKR